MQLANAYAVQSRLHDAFTSIHRAQILLQSTPNPNPRRITSQWHSILGLCNLTCGDMDSADVNFNIALDHLRGNLTSHNSHLTRIRLARTELSRQRPSSCLAQICSAEAVSFQSAYGELNCQLLRTDLCIFLG